MENYLPSPFDFLTWEEIKRSFLKKKVLNFPKCIELNITFEKGKWENFKKEIDIFTLERVLKEIKKMNVEWLVFGYKNDIFAHKSIKSFFKILKELDLKIFSLQTDALYLNRVEPSLLLNLVKRKIFIKEKGNIKPYEKSIFMENLKNLLKFKKDKKILKPEIFIINNSFKEEEKKDYKERGAEFIDKLSFCPSEVYPYLPFFFLSIENNGFCYVSENLQNPIGTIFFDKIKKIWFSKRLKKLRKNIIKENKIEFLNSNLKGAKDVKNLSH